MFELNPLLHENAWWQHVIMFVGAGVLGYIIGYRSGESKTFLQNQLSSKYLLNMSIYNFNKRPGKEKGPDCHF